MKPVPYLYDPVENFPTALARIEAYLWAPGPGYTPEEIASLRMKVGHRQAEPERCRGYNLT